MVDDELGAAGKEISKGHGCPVGCAEFVVCRDGDHGQIAQFLGDDVCLFAVGLFLLEEGEAGGAPFLGGGDLGLLDV